MAMPSVPKRKRINDKVVRQEARKPYCEACGKATLAGEGAHHIGSKGAGFPDHPWNLIMLCNECHIYKAHGGHYSKRFLFEIVAKREGVSVEEVENTVWGLKA